MDANLETTAVDNERKLFEDAAYRQYFYSTVSFNPNKQFADCTAKPKDEWMARNEDGSYKESSLNFAWWGWQERHAALRAYRTSEEDLARFIEHADSLGLDIEPDAAGAFKFANPFTEKAWEIYGMGLAECRTADPSRLITNAIALGTAHDITDDKVVFHQYPGRPGNALSQLVSAIAKVFTNPGRRTPVMDRGSRIAHRLDRLGARETALREKHEGREQEFTYHGGYDLGYVQGQISVLHDWQDAQNDAEAGQGSEPAPRKPGI